MTALVATVSHSHECSTFVLVSVVVSAPRKSNRCEKRTSGARKHNRQSRVSAMFCMSVGWRYFDIRIGSYAVTADIGKALVQEQINIYRKSRDGSKVSARKFKLQYLVQRFSFIVLRKDFFSVSFYGSVVNIWFWQSRWRSTTVDKLVIVTYFLW
jgi:hypothetical protein